MTNQRTNQQKYAEEQWTPQRIARLKNARLKLRESAKRLVSEDICEQDTTTYKFDF